MCTRKTQNFVNTALNFWGKESQIEQAVEECSELIQAIQKYKRLKAGQYQEKSQEVMNNLYEEIADVSITLELLKEIFRTPDDKIENFVEMKKQKAIDYIDSRTLDQEEQYLQTLTGLNKGDLFLLEFKNRLKNLVITKQRKTQHTIEIDSRNLIKGVEGKLTIKLSYESFYIHRQKSFASVYTGLIYSGCNLIEEFKVTNQKGLIEKISKIIYAK